MDRHRVGSTVLLAGGVLLVFAGLSSALGYSTSGMVASFATILALLYAGGVWLGQPPRTDPSVLLFTHTLTVAGGPADGRPVADMFPERMRNEIASRCREALDGRGLRFSCGGDASTRTFEAVPVRSADGTVLYGLLLSGDVVTRAAAEQVTA